MFWTRLKRSPFAFYYADTDRYSAEIWYNRREIRYDFAIFKNQTGEVLTAGYSSGSSGADDCKRQVSQALSASGII
jgi:hypothetical protein